MGLLDYIPDGYTLSAEKEFSTGTLKIIYRPVVSSSRMAYAAIGKAAGSIAAEVINRHVSFCLELPRTKEMDQWILETIVLSPTEEKAQMDNLALGVWMQEAYPTVANRDCEMCLKYRFDEITGKILKNRKGEPIERTGKAPCEAGHCPKGKWDNQRSFTDMNRRAHVFHQECKAVCSWPDDPIVRRNARVIEQATEKANARRQ